MRSPRRCRGGAEPQGLPRIPLQRPGVDLRAGRPDPRSRGLAHAVPDLTHAFGRPDASDSGPDRLHHRGPGRARPGPGARGVDPPVAVLPSLSRLMEGGIGAGRTREDHRTIANLLYAGCAAAERARGLEAIVGTDELTPREPGPRRSRTGSSAASCRRRTVAVAPSRRRSVARVGDRRRAPAGGISRSSRPSSPRASCGGPRGRRRDRHGHAVAPHRAERRRRAIDTGIDLLDRKREGLLRALAERARTASALRGRLAGDLGAAHGVLDRALVEIGEAPALAATLGQPPAAALTVATDAVVGVRVTRLVARFDAGPPQVRSRGHLRGARPWRGPRVRGDSSGRGHARGRRGRGAQPDARPAAHHAEP